MAAEAVAGLAEGLVPLAVGLCELVILFLQLMMLVAELVFHLVWFLIELIVRAFTKEPVTPRVSLTDKIRATMEKRFGGHEGELRPGEEPGKIWNPYSHKPTPPFKWERRHTAALLIWAAVIAVIMIAVGLVWGRRFDLTVTEAELQQAVAGKFPMSKTVLRVEVTLRSPVVKLDERLDRLGMTMDCDVKVQGIPVTARGKLTASGRLVYRPEHGAFYVNEVTVDRIDLVDVPDRWEAKANDAAGAVAREAFERFPVYRLKEDRWKEKAAKLVLRRVRVENGELVLTMGVG